MIFRWRPWLRVSRKDESTVSSIGPGDQPHELIPKMFRPFTIWSEKVAGCGEDAEPLIVISEDNKFGMAAVFDGLGGSGAGRFDFSTGSITGAKLASSIGRDCLIETVRRVWLDGPRNATVSELGSGGVPIAGDSLQPAPQSSSLERDEQPPKSENPYSDGNLQTKHFARLADGVGACFTFTPTPNPALIAFDSTMLGRSFDRAFGEAMARLGVQASNSRIKSRAKRNLPTTFAGVFFAEFSGTISLRAFWAGDSRLYFLCNQGLYQLSSDHSRPNASGAFAGGDAPMTRVVSEQIPNEIDCYYSPPISSPGFVIACTDGAYGYFPTSVHFELAIWSALERAAPVEQAAALSAHIERITQDDASLALVPIGFPSSTGPTAQRRTTLISLYEAFERNAAALKDLKPRVAKLEEQTEALRTNMQALPPAMLESGEVLR